MLCIYSLFHSPNLLKYPNKTIFVFLLVHYYHPMVPEEKPKLTEINVRMDCNGCIQKIKKALHGINGIYDLHIDFPQQKLIVIGWADPEKIVKAIKKARKTAMIVSHSEVPDPPPAQPTEQSPPDQPPPDQQAAQPPEPSATPPPEQPKDTPAHENPPPDTKPSNITNDSSSTPQPSLPSDPKEGEDVRVMYYHPSPDHGYRYNYSPNYSHSYDGKYNSNPNYSGYHQETLLRQATPQPMIHNYNTYKPSSSVIHTYNTYRPTLLYAEDNFIRSPPQYTHYRRQESYSDDYSNNGYENDKGNGNITSIFSDENPNACKIA